jgi:hypothetical protein
LLSPFRFFLCIGLLEDYFRAGSHGRKIRAVP